jgi:hypothetical protein
LGFNKVKVTDSNACSNELVLKKVKS